MERIHLTGAGREPAVGRLLVATPQLQDPNFARTLVLLLDLNSDGALGVVLNRPSDVQVGMVLDDAWERLCGDPGVLFQGGPVSANQALALARLAPSQRQSPAEGWQGLAEAGGVATVGLVDLDTQPALLGDAIRDVRVFAGYAGWSGGQLEDEIADGAWVVVPATQEDVFDQCPDRLWERVLRRQPGTVAWLSTMPNDPAFN